MEYGKIKKVLEELQYFSAYIKEEEVANLIEAIEKADRIFVAGSGRSGFAARGFANRLMHLGYTAYFVGETTTPPIKKGDLLLVGSGSGKTSGLVAVAQKAKNLQADIATITLNPDGIIADFADVVVCLPGNTRLADAGGSKERESFQPVGALFEQLCWLLYDSVVSDLLERTGQDFDDMLERHGNLE